MEVALKKIIEGAKTAQIGIRQIAHYYPVIAEFEMERYLSEFKPSTRPVLISGFTQHAYNPSVLDAESTVLIRGKDGEGKNVMIENLIRQNRMQDAATWVFTTNPSSFTRSLDVSKAHPAGKVPVSRLKNYIFDTYTQDPHINNLAEISKSQFGQIATTLLNSRGSQNHVMIVFDGLSKFYSTFAMKCIASLCKQSKDLNIRVVVVDGPQWHENSTQDQGFEEAYKLMVGRFDAIIFKGKTAIELLGTGLTKDIKMSSSGCALICRSAKLPSLCSVPMIIDNEM